MAASPLWFEGSSVSCPDCAQRNPPAATGTTKRPRSAITSCSVAITSSEVMSSGVPARVMGKGGDHLARDHGQQNGKAQFGNVPRIVNIKAELGRQQEIGRRESADARRQDRNDAAEIDSH